MNTADAGDTGPEPLPHQITQFSTAFFVRHVAIVSNKRSPTLRTHHVIKNYIYICDVTGYSLSSNVSHVLEFTTDETQNLLPAT